MKTGSPPGRARPQQGRPPPPTHAGPAEPGGSPFHRRGLVRSRSDRPATARLAPRPVARHLAVRSWVAARTSRAETPIARPPGAHVVAREISPNGFTRTRLKQLEPALLPIAPGAAGGRRLPDESRRCRRPERSAIGGGRPKPSTSWCGGAPSMKSRTGGRAQLRDLAPLIEAIYRRIGGARQRALHRLVARVLVALQGHYGAAAGHFVRSADVGDSKRWKALRGAAAGESTSNIMRALCAARRPARRPAPGRPPLARRARHLLVAKADWVVEHRMEQRRRVYVRNIARSSVEVNPDPARRATVKFHLGTFLAWGGGDPQGHGHGRKRADLFQLWVSRTGPGWLATS